MTTTPSSQDSSTNSTDTTPPTPQGWTRFRLVLVLGAVTALGPFTIDMYLSAFPFIAHDLGTSDELVQFTLTGSLVGFALGQLIIGPLSDALGRRRPLIAGSAMHVVASVGCAVAPTIETLAALRVLQGLGAAAGTVLALAVVRDLFDGHAAAVVISRLMLVMGVAPVLAPTIGGLVVSLASWRSIFFVLALLGLISVALGVWAMPETLPPVKRHRPRMRVMARNYRTLFSDSPYVRMVIVCGCGRILMFSYIASSPFVLQNQFELTPGQFGVFFACGAAVLIGSSQLNVVLLRRWSPYGILRASLAVGTLVGGVFVVLAVTETGGLAGFGVPVLLLLGVMGSVMPNAPALALARHPDTAGTASALIGGFQFLCAAAAAPVVGLLGNNALATASMMGVAAAVALGLVVTTRPLAGAER